MKSLGNKLTEIHDQGVLTMLLVRHIAQIKPTHIFF